MPARDLTVERRRDPLGIDVARPRFAWRLDEERQAAYQLEVLDGNDTVWDSGRVESSNSIYVQYDGQPLRARTRYTWRVRTWPQGDWSPTASFEMGLLAPTDWSARWICHLQPDQWTDYHTRVQYQTYDVSGLLIQGENVLAVRVGAGWYTGSVGAWGRQRYGDVPMLCGQLEVDQQVIARTDADWRGLDGGTWLDDLQLGERTDLRNEPASWTDAAFDAAAWRPVSMRADPGARRVAARDDGIQVVQRLPAVAVHRADADRYIVDVGANIAGVLQLRVHGQPGDRISLRHAEAVDRNGELYTENILTSLRANFISIPTDCPQRNERLGWTADLQIFAPTALFNADLSNMIDKWLDDLADSQMPSGAYADVAPTPSGFVGWGNTAWSDAGIIVPWTLYERSGDAGVLERVYDSMRRYLAFLEADQRDGLRFGGRYGDWVSLGARTDKTFIGTAYLAYASDLFSRIARVVNRAEDAEHYAEFASNVRAAFTRAFVASSGLLNVETQTSYAIALGFGLLPRGTEEQAGTRLAELVEDAGVHLATGFLGTPLVMPALSDTGHHELACRLMRQTTYPSWLFEVEQGATSIWERWNGWTPENGFYSPRMNSFNHYAFGAVGDWLAPGTHTFEVATGSHPAG